MLYRGYWIEFVSFSEQGNALFLIRRRHEREILAEADSVSQALEIVRSLDRLALSRAGARFSARKGAA
jgi:hypothetical protein